MLGYRWLDSWGAFSGRSGFCYRASAFAVFFLVFCFHLLVREFCPDVSASNFFGSFYFLAVKCSVRFPTVSQSRSVSTILRSRISLSIRCAFFEALSCFGMLVVVLDGSAVVESSFCRWTQAFSTRYLAAVFGRALYLFVVGELSSFVACGVPFRLVEIIRTLVY